MLFCSGAGAATPSPQARLVTTEWLAQNLDNQQVRIVEVSVNPGLYERGHVPGAVNFSWHQDLNDRVRRDIVGKEAFEALLSKAGVSQDTTVVLYGDTNNWFAAWGAWVFDIYGVKNVKLLDGGRKKWEAENQLLNNRVPEFAVTIYKVAKVNTDPRGLLAIVLALAVGVVGYTVVLGSWLPVPQPGKLPLDMHIGPVSWVLVVAGLSFGAGMVVSGSCISAHWYRLAEGSAVSPFALVGSALGFVLGFITWNPLYSLSVADAPVV